LNSGTSLRLPYVQDDCARRGNWRGRCVSSSIIPPAVT
jgi:hypothetical protein